MQPHSPHNDHKAFSSNFLSELKTLGVETVSAQQLESEYEAQASAQLHHQAIYGDRRVQSLESKIRAMGTEVDKLASAIHSVTEPDLKSALHESLTKKRKLLQSLKDQHSRLISENQARSQLQTKVNAATQIRFDDALASARALNTAPSVESSPLDRAEPPAKRRKVSDTAPSEPVDEEDAFVDIDDSSPAHPVHPTDDHYSSSSSDEEWLNRDADLGIDVGDDEEVPDIGGGADTAAPTDAKGSFTDDFYDVDFRTRLISANLSDTETVTSVSGNYGLPSFLYEKLFPHQQVCVSWLWELHKQRCGGIIGDEMGLGKTLEVIAFLDGLYSSKLVPQQRPSLVVCPATVLRQWVREFHTWAPGFRVLAYHPTFCRRASSSGAALQTVLKKCISCSASSPTVVVTTYEMVRTQSQYLVSGPSSIPPWFYVVLDEGHKLRNPDARITVACKQFETPHRIVLTGAPIQNNLTELWSLFDLIFPGKLGTQEMFESQFASPILRGGYANATPFEARMAYKCAVVLRDLIKPFLLRRLKKDVQIHLPEKNEQVLFCKLTPAQRFEYLKFLASKEAKLVFSGKKNMLYGVDLLRKICNHTFLLQSDKGAASLSALTTSLPTASAEQDHLEIDLSSIPAVLASYSAKLKVVNHILKLWWSEGDHKVLLFAQTRQMLDIIELFVKQSHYPYLRMDGNSAIQKRAALIDHFNSSPPSDSFIFLLTTRVGGLGVNLTAADKVLIFDPDWNPVTDLQARERSYRIGQTRSVTIYRLVTLGTIEEKIYQRQIFKQFLTNRILTNPSLSKSLFKSSDLRELFRFDDREHHVAADASVDPKAALSVQNPESPEETKVGTSEEDNILQDLMGDSLHSRINHDRLIGDSSGADDSFNKEAEKIATAAVARLRDSRRRVDAAEAPQSLQSWSGAGKFGKSSRAAAPASKPASETLLSNMRNSNSFSLSAQDALLRDLHAYLERRGGSASSEALVSAFADRVSGPDSLRVFKSLLKQIADLQKSDGLWRLRADF
jgi:DNA excision repair protein ERCC-6